MQFQADILNLPIVRPQCIETTALGAANLAALGVGFFGDLEEIRAAWQQNRAFMPTMEASMREEQLEGWHNAVSRSLGWAAK